MDRQLHLTQSPAAPWRFVRPPGEEAYSLLLITLAAVPREEKNRIAAEITASGARYIVCWGLDCEDWHDTLDCAYLQTDENFAPPDERFVMTTWHDDEPLDAAVFHLWFCGMLDGACPRTVGIFVLGDSSDIRPAVKAAVASEISEAHAATL